MTKFLADTSAWHRSRHADIASEWQERLALDQMATCAPLRLEILYSAKSASDYEQLADELLALHQLPCGTEQFDRALAVQRLLADTGGLHHRSVKVPDLLVAATAELAGAVIWHYDEDYDRIASVTGQPTEWIAPRGSL